MYIERLPSIYTVVSHVTWLSIYTLVKKYKYNKLQGTQYDTHFTFNLLIR